MDPKAANNLDPKMKETYDRVMGTSTTPNAAPAAAAPMATTPAASTPTTPPAANTPFGTAPSMPDNLQFQAAIQAAPAQPATTSVGVAVPNQTSSMVRILYIVGSVVFFAAYTYLWIKIFNISLPF